MNTLDEFEVTKKVQEEVTKECYEHVIKKNPELADPVQGTPAHRKLMRLMQQHAIWLMNRRRDHPYGTGKQAKEGVNFW